MNEFIIMVLSVVAICFLWISVSQILDTIDEYLQNKHEIATQEYIIKLRQIELECEQLKERHCKCNTKKQKSR